MIHVFVIQSVTSDVILGWLRVRLVVDDVSHGIELAPSRRDYILNDVFTFYMQCTLIIKVNVKYFKNRTCAIRLEMFEST